jgi:hypothetical protein
MHTTEDWGAILNAEVVPTFTFRIAGQGGKTSNGQELNVSSWVVAGRVQCSSARSAASSS